MSQSVSYASCPSEFSWTLSAGVGPCQVATSLIGLCDTTAQPLMSLRNGQHYTSPTLQDQNICSCSSAVYALVSACSLCQGGSIVKWSDWSRDCRTAFSDGFPFPQNAVPIPSWAIFDGSRFDQFDLVRASIAAVGPAPPTAGITSPTDIGTTTGAVPVLSQVTILQTITTVPSSTPTSDSRALASISSIQTPKGSIKSTTTEAGHATDPNQPVIVTGVPQSSPTESSTPLTVDQQGDAKKSNTGALAGGVVGGLALLAILGGAVFWWIKRRQRSRLAPSAAYIAAYGAPRPATSMSQSPFQERANSPMVAMGSARYTSPFPDEKLQMRLNSNPNYTMVPRAPSPTLL